MADKPMADTAIVRQSDGSPLSLTGSDGARI
jgi:hypothetical protein